MPRTTVIQEHTLNFIFSNLFCRLEKWNLLAFRAPTSLLTISMRMVLLTTFQ